MNKAGANRVFFDKIAPTLEVPVTQELVDWAFDLFRKQMFFRGIICARQCYRWKHHGITVEDVNRRLNELPSARRSRDNHRIRYQV